MRLLGLDGRDGFLHLLCRRRLDGLFRIIELAHLGTHGLERALLTLPRLSLAAALFGLVPRGERGVERLVTRYSYVESAALECGELADPVECGEEVLRGGVTEALRSDALRLERLDGTGEEGLVANPQSVTQKTIKVELVCVRELHGQVDDLLFCHEMPLVFATGMIVAA